MCGATSAMDRAEATISPLMAHACVITPVIRVTPWVSWAFIPSPALQAAGDVPGGEVAYGGTRVSVCAACPALWDVLCLSRGRTPAADHRRASMTW
jgi:hypothetical protein